MGVVTPDWMEQAACKGKEPALWFPLPLGGPNGPEFSAAEQRNVDRAKTYCRTCPTREECLEFGLHEEHGIYGGKTPRERRAILRNRNDGRLRQPVPKTEKRCKGCQEMFTPARSNREYCTRECYMDNRASWLSPTWARARV